METLQRTANRGSISTGYDIDNSLKTVKRMKFSVDLSQTLINIAQEINLQQEDPLI